MYIRKIDQIIDGALRLEENEQENFIKEACGKNQDLLKVALEYYSFIIKADEQDFLEEGLGEYAYLLDKEAIQDQTESISKLVIGKDIGPYRIRESIGEGGMGMVYLAERIDGEFDQSVAVKFVRGGLFSDYMRKRFAIEKRILSKLDHPNIARLLDGGITDDGIPFLIMEYVEGLPLDEYCNENNIDTRGRIDLFLQICRAVQSAHSNLIIHRDLKPQNILVNPKGQVKVMDFGIAKFTDPDADEESVFRTRDGNFIASLGYAAPEQFRSEDPTLATDIYQLGLVLHKLLTGRLPYSVKECSPAEAEQIICETKPAKPSTHVDREKDDNQWPVQPDQLKGDLDTIILKALQKEPGKRYGSAEMLAGDIERHLAGLPILARPATMRYRAGKFIVRHRRVLAAVCLMIAGLAGIIFHYTSQLADERDTAQYEAERAEAINTFLIDVFETADPEVNRGEEISAGEMLNRGVDMAANLTSQPELQVDMLAIAGEIYRSLGDYDNAGNLIEQALTQARAIYGDEHEVVASIKYSMGTVLMSKGDHKMAEKYIIDALELQRKLLGNMHSDVASSLYFLGNIRMRAGDFTTADDFFREALIIRQSVLGYSHPEVAYSLSGLGNLSRRMRDFDKAIDKHNEALNIRRSVFGDNHPSVAKSLSHLGITYGIQGDHQQALVMFEEAYEILRSVYGDIHPEVVRDLNNIGVTQRRMGNYEQAQEIYREVLEIRKSILNNTHPDIARSYNNLGAVYRYKGNYQEARILNERALEIRRAALGDFHPDVASSLNHLGLIYRQLAEYERALAVHKEALDIRRYLFGDEDRSVATSLHNLGALFHTTGEYEKARISYEESLHIRKSVFGNDHPTVATALNNLGILFRDIGKYEQAYELIKNGLQIRQTALDDDHILVARSLTNLGSVIQHSGTPIKARTKFKQAQKIFDKNDETNNSSFATLLKNKAVNYQIRDEHETALEYLHRSLDIRLESLPETHWRIGRLKNLMGASLFELGKYEAAANKLSDGLDILINELGEDHHETKAAKERMDYYAAR